MLNKVILIGNLGKDPDVRATQNGMSVASLSLATTKKWNDKNGQQQEKTQWHNIVVWGKMADNCGKYLKKGSKVYVEGEIDYRSYEKDGQTRYATDIVCSNIQFLSSINKQGAPHPAEVADENVTPF